MALTRKFLTALGIEPDKIDEIIDAHTTTVNALKEERDKFKVDHDALEQAQAELASLQSAAEKNKNNPYKEQYEQLKAEYEQFKKDVETRELTAKKTDAYRALLLESGVPEKRIAAIMRVTSVDDIELDASGKIKGSEDIKAKIVTEWADFIQTEDSRGADTQTPPANNGAKERTVSRAAQVAAKHYETIYGKKDGGIQS